MTDAIEMVSQIGHRVVYRATEQILAIVQFGKLMLSVYGLDRPSCISSGRFA